MPEPTKTREGYLLMWPESHDEVHIDLISQRQYDQYLELAKGWDQDPVAAKQRCREYLDSITPMERWFTMYACQEPWPYNDVVILGTLCFDMC